MDFSSGPQSGRAPPGLRSLLLLLPPARLYIPASLLWPRHLLYVWSLFTSCSKWDRMCQLIPKYFRFGQKQERPSFLAQQPQQGCAYPPSLSYRSCTTSPSSTLFLLHQLCFFPLYNNLKYSSIS